MKKIWSICVIIAVLFSLQSCDNEVQLAAEWQDIPIVYGLISRQDTASYIRIQKAFLDPDGNALDAAQVADSLYYEGIDVSIQEVETGNLFDLVRVDGNLEGYPKEEGTFANDPNYLYKLKLPAGEELTPGKRYELQINRGDTKPEITASTNVVGDIQFTGPFEVAPLKIIYRDFALRWANPPGAAFYDVKIVVHYKENSADNPVLLRINRSSGMWWKIWSIIPATRSLKLIFRERVFIAFSAMPSPKKMMAYSACSLAWIL